MAELKISSDLQNVIKKIVLDTYYPIGKIYITIGNENPNETIGGTWIKFGAGRCLIGVDTSQTEFNAVEKTGGEKTHKLTLSEMPYHCHTGLFYMNNGKNITLDSGGSNYNLSWGSTGNSYNEVYTGYTGDGQPHNNLQPYITVYMWKRTA